MPNEKVVCAYCNQSDKRFAIVTTGGGSATKDGYEIRGNICVDCMNAGAYRG